jgi:hypothetical protein
MDQEGQTLQDLLQADPAQYEIGELAPDLIRPAKEFQLMIDEGAVHPLGDLYESDPAAEQDKRQTEPGRFLDELGRHIFKSAAEPDQQARHPRMRKPPDELPAEPGI